VTRNGVPIYKIKLKDAYQTGIEVDRIPGLVPEFYERQACNKANYCFDTTWQNLSMPQKASHIAQYTLENLLERHHMDAQTRHINARSKGKKR